MFNLILVFIVCILKINGLGPRVLSGTWTAVDNTIEINIIAGYGNSGSIKDGVNVTVTSTEANVWIGMAFTPSLTSNAMSNAAALTCIDGNQPQERNIDPNVGGTPSETPVGTGTCDVGSTPTLVWAIDGYDLWGRYTVDPMSDTILLLTARGTSTTFGNHGQTNRAKNSVSLTCSGDCATDTDNPTSMPSTSPVMTPQVSGRTYTGTKTVGGSSLMFTITVVINVDYAANDGFTNGVTVTATKTSSSNRWIGIGFGTQMAGTSSIICSDGTGTTVQRSLGGDGNRMGSVITFGAGTCTSENDNISWTSAAFTGEGFNFPIDGSNLNIIWAYGSGSAFGYHGNKGSGQSITFQCAGNCDAAPTQDPSSAINKKIGFILLFTIVVSLSFV